MPCALTLSSCGLTLPVSGSLSDGSEAFTGTATGQIDGAGTLGIVGTRGTSCEGDFVYTTSREGRGTFRCRDGRTGPFEFVSTGTRGTGTGSIGGEPFTFSFG